MSPAGHRTRRLPDVGAPGSSETANHRDDTLEDITELAGLSPRELWNEAAERWAGLGLAWSNATVAQVLGVPEERVTRWQRSPELPLAVRKQLAAFSQLLSALESGRLVSLPQAEIGNMVAMVRGPGGQADRETAREVLSLLESLFDEPAPPPAV